MKNLRMLFEKYERLDVKREWTFKELTDMLNEALQKEFREFNESSGSKYLVKRLKQEYL